MSNRRKNDYYEKTRKDKGIYAYLDKENNNEIVYIGLDSNIYKNKRHSDHLSKSNYNKQVINRVLQNNIDRYEYKVLEKGKYTKKELGDMERDYIEKYNPKFNFTKGGEIEPVLTRKNWFYDRTRYNRTLVARKRKGLKSDFTILQLDKNKPVPSKTKYGCLYSGIYFDDENLSSPYPMIDFNYCFDSWDYDEDYDEKINDW